MGKTFKVIVYFIVWSTIFVAGLFLAVALLVDPNDYKDDLIRLVKDQTGRDLQIKQDMALSFFPWIGVELGGLELSNAKDFGGGSFAGVAEVRVRVKLMPLFKKQLEADSISVKGLRLNLAKNATGKTNWADLLSAKVEQPPADTPSRDHVGTSASSTPAAVALAVSGLKIENAALSWRDDVANVAYTIENINLSTGNLAFGKAFDVTLGFGLSSNEPSLTANVQLSGQANLDLAGQLYRFSSAVLNVDAQGKAVPEGRTKLTLNFDAMADLGKETLSIEGLKLASMGVDASGKIYGTSIVTKPSFNADLSLSEFDLGALLAKVTGQNIATSDPNVLKRFSAKVSVTAGLDAAKVTSLEAHLDESMLQGLVSVANFQKPAIRFDLVLDEMDVDRYLPPKKVASEHDASPTNSIETNKSETNKSVSKGPSPLKPLRNLDLNGNFKAGRIKVANAKLADLEVGIKAKGGVINLKPLSVNLYKGRFVGNSKIDVRTYFPVLSVQYDLTNLQAGSLLEDVVGVDRISGTTRSSAKITTKGLESEPLIQNLNGTANFMFANGALKGINIARLIRNAYNVLKGLPPEPEYAAQKTDFAELSGSVTIKNGIIKNQDLNMKSPLLRISGQGDVDLPNNKIDYVVKSAIVGTMKGQGGEAIEGLKNVVVPVNITGSLDNPKIVPDVAAILKENLRGQAKEKLKEKLREKLKDKGLGGVLDNIVPGGGGGLFDKVLSF